MVFSVMPLKTDQNQNQKAFKRLSLESEKTKKGNYAKTLTKIQVTSIFPMQDMGNAFRPNL